VVRCRHHGWNCGKAIVIPNRTVVWRATGAFLRYAIHSPLTKKFRGGEPSRGITYPRARLSGKVVGEPSFGLPPNAERRSEE